MIIQEDRRNKFLESNSKIKSSIFIDRIDVDK